MARLARLYAPSIPHYVVQRAADGRSICTDAADYALLHETLEQAVRRRGLALHAYVLLPTEIRLLATPATAGELPAVMQDIGRRYVPYANARAGRLGALWRGRFRSTLLDPALLLPVMRHLERRPVAIGVAGEPASWRWSSHAHHVGDRAEAFVQDHAGYWALADSPFGRQAAYRTALDAAEDDGTSHRSDAIEKAVLHGWALGEPAFIAAIAQLSNRRPSGRSPGRPRCVPNLLRPGWIVE